ncbi:hypothetical protein HY486_02380 [Candidatus Woesearchaeota archaeon]|nr:hypothetical protein [Candidatus Woesearchaeota archaeon]
MPELEKVVEEWYPKGGILTKVDNTLCKVAGYFGDTYQRITGKPTKYLVATAYEASVVGFGVGLIGPTLVSTLFLLQAYLKRRVMQIRSPAEEEKINKNNGSALYPPKLSRICGALCTIPATYGGINDTLKGISTHDAYQTLRGLCWIVLIGAFTSLSFGDYLSRAKTQKTTTVSAS